MIAEVSVVLSTSGPSVICTGSLPALTGGGSSAAAGPDPLRRAVAVASRHAAASPFTSITALSVREWRKRGFPDHLGFAERGRRDRDEAVCQRLQERNQVIFFCIGQAQIRDRHVLVVVLLGHRPARYLFHRPFRAVPGLDIERELVARVVEMHDLLQAQQIPVVHKRLYKHTGRVPTGGRWRYLSDIAQCRGLELADKEREKRNPVGIRRRG